MNTRILRSEVWKSDYAYAYGCIAVIAFANLTIVSISRIQVNLLSLGEELLTIAVLFVGYCLLQYVESSKRFPRLLDSLKKLIFGLVFLRLAWLNLRLLNHISMSTALPFADELLITWDGMIGLDWMAYFQLVHDQPKLARILSLSYTSLTPLSVIAYTALHIAGLANRARYFVELFFFTAVAAMLIGALFPAEAAVIAYELQLTDFPNYGKLPGTYHIEHMERLRAQSGPIPLDVTRLPGLVTFPSFHTAAGVILCISTYATRAFFPVLLYAVVMIASTPILGGHYFVDLIGGALLACAVAVLLNRTARYRVAEVGVAPPSNH